jgi:hypothetical protein
MAKFENWPFFSTVKFLVSINNFGRYATHNTGPLWATSNFLLALHVQRPILFGASINFLLHFSSDQIRDCFGAEK